MASCSPTQKKVETATDSLKETVSIDSLIKHPEAYIGSSVTVKGIVFHTCRETGKKMFIYRSNSDSTLKVVASDSIKIFDKSLEGTNVIVKGILQEQKVDAAFIANMEKRAMANSSTVAEKKEKVAGEAHLHEGMGSMKQVEALKKQLNDSGKDHLSFYSLVAWKIEKCNEGNKKNPKGGAD